MKLRDFIESRSEEWDRLEKLLDALERTRGRPATAEEAASLPERYRAACQDLALAERRMYGMRLLDRLNDLVRRGHRHLHRERSLAAADLARFLRVTFPDTVRRHAGLFWLAMAAFWGPLLLTLLLSHRDPLWMHTVLGPSTMAQLERMYAPSAGDTPMRSGGDVRMFGYYIFNNISIDLRTFAGGLFGGVGSLFYLAANGLFLGAAAGYVHEAASPERFYGFVAAHSPFELLGMAIAGMAGMKLGLAFLRPGLLTRGDSLRRATPDAVRLLYGAVGLTLVAAAVEAFFSPLALPPPVKYATGVGGWAVLGVYLLFQGRRHAA